MEAHNAQREMFGSPRLRTLLDERADAAPLVDLLLDELRRFTGEGWEQADDVTMAILQRMAEQNPHTAG